MNSMNIYLQIRKPTVAFCWLNHNKNINEKYIKNRINSNLFLIRFQLEHLRRHFILNKLKIILMYLSDEKKINS